MLCFADRASVLELSLFGFEALANMVVVAVFDILVLNSSHVMSVLFRESLLVRDGLDRGMVMVLVDLSINYFLGVDTLSGLDSLILDGGIDVFVDSGIVFTVSVEETADCCLCFVHCSEVLVCVSLKVEDNGRRSDLQSYKAQAGGYDIGFEMMVT